MHCMFSFFVIVLLFASCSKPVQLPTSSSASLMPITKTKPPMLQVQAFATEDSPTLLELIDYALKNNPQTKIAYFNALAANEDIRLKKSAYFPSINLAAQYQRVRHTDFPATDRFWETTWGPYLQLAYTILDFGNRRYRVNEAMAQLKSFNYLHAQTLQQIIQQVRDDYYELIAQKELTISATANVENALATFEVAKAKYFLGIVDFLDLSQAKSSYLQNRTDLLNQKNSQSKAFYLLANDLGNPTQPTFKIAGFDKPPTIAQFRKASHFIGIAQQLNPRIQSLIEQINAAKFALKSEKSQRWPLITTQFQIGRTYYNSIHDDYDMTLRFNFTIPLYNGGKIKSSVEKAKYNLKIARQQLLNARNTLTYNVLTLRSDLKTSFETLDLAAQSLEAAQEQYRVAFSQYSAGTADILILINAQINLAGSKATYINAQKSWHVFLTDIALKMGLLVNGNLSKEILFKQGKQR